MFQHHTIKKTRCLTKIMLVYTNPYKSCLNYRLSCQLFGKMLVKYIKSGCVGLHDIVRCSHEILTKTGFLLCTLECSSYFIQQHPSRRTAFPFIWTDKHNCNFNYHNRIKTTGFACTARTHIK
jgi:hypothetical protein